MSAEPRRALAVCAAFALAAFAFNTSELLPIGLLGVLQRRLGVSATAAGLLASGYGLTVAATSLPLARWTRQVPRRHLLTAVLAVLALTCSLSCATTCYAVMMAARVAGALAQAVFWAVMPPTAAGLFAARHSGRVLALVSFGGSLALVIGLPTEVWLGRAIGLWAPFVALGVLGLVPLAVISALLPTTPPARNHAAYAAAPDTRRFAIVLATTALASTAIFASYTYIVTFLTSVSGFAPSAVAGLLAVFGVAGTAGVLGAGLLLDRSPRTAMLVPVALQGAALAGLFLFGTTRPAVLGLLALFGLSSTPVYTAMQSRALHVAPGRTEIAMSATSMAWNAGIALGALVGGLVVATHGVRETFPAGALLTLAALAALLSEPLIARGVVRPTTRLERP